MPDRQNRSTSFSDAFILVRSCNNYSIAHDFHISKFPVMLASGTRARLASDADSLLYRTTWEAAAQFCDHLSGRNGLRPLYREIAAMDADEVDRSDTGVMVQESFRMPTPEEWNYAAHGWSGARTGDYFQIQKAHFRIPFQDHPTSEEERRLFEQGYDRREQLIANPIGILGMNVYAREWCDPLQQLASRGTTAMKWEEYFTNYDNDIGYQTTAFTPPAGELLPFRIVLPRRKAGR